MRALAGPNFQHIVRKFLATYFTILEGWENNKSELLTMMLKFCPANALIY